MLFARNNREDLQNLNELVSLQDQVKAVRLQDELGKLSRRYEKSIRTSY